MTTLGSPVYAGSSNNPLWLSGNPTSISLQGSAPLVLTNSNGQLAENGQVVSASSNWSLYPAISNTIYMDVSNTLTNSGNNLYYNGNLIANASDIQNIADWSLYTAASDVTLSNGVNRYSIVGARNITAVSNVNGAVGTFTTTLISPGLSNTGNVALSANTGSMTMGATSNLTASAGTILSNSGPTVSNTFTNAYNVLGNRGVDYSDFCYTNISNRGGKGGQINLTADAGSVDIGGTTYSVGGLINITANSALSLPYNATSAIKMSAAGVNIYAGAFPSTLAPLGQMYLWGQLGMSLTSTVSPPGFNTVPQTVYIYGTNGTKIDGTCYMSNLVNYTGANLNIHPDSSNWVDILRCQKLGMGNNPVIDGGGGTTSFISNFYGISTTANGGVGVGTGGITTLGSITNGLDTPLYVTQPDLNLYAYKTQSALLPPTYVYHNINLNSSSNINLVTSNGGQVYINGTAYVAGSLPSNWAAYSASQSVNFSNYSISNLSNINGVPFTTLVRNPMVGDLDAGAHTISNVSNIYGTSVVGNLSVYNVNGNIIVSAPTAGSNVQIFGGSNGASATFGQSGTTITQVGGSIQLNATGGINVTNNNISNVAALISTSSITIQPVSGLYLTSFLNMGSNPINNVTAITSPSNLSITTGGTISMNHLLDMGSNGISNVGNLTGVGTVNGGYLMYNPATQNLNMSQNYISNVIGITASTAGQTPSNFIMTNTNGNLQITAPISNITQWGGYSMTLEAGGTQLLPTHQITMSPSGSPMYISSSNAISINSPSNYIYGPLDMTINPITNVSTLNGHYLYQVGAWCSTGTTTLTANTPASVVWDTQLVSPVGNIFAGASNYISCGYAGNYLIQATLEFTSSAGGGTNSDIYAWIQTQGSVDLANSSRHIDVAGGRTTQLTLTSTVTNPNAFRIMCATSSSSVSFTYSAAQSSPYARPAQPSANLSVMLIS